MRVIATVKKIRKLTHSVDAIAAALRPSEELLVSDDGKWVGCARGPSGRQRMGP